MRERARRWGLVALVIAAVVGARVLSDARTELDAGRRALAEGHDDVGVRRLRRAAHLYLPLSPYTRDAYDALEAYARAAESRGQNDRALSAWRAVRSSALATRWLVIPYREQLERANRRIARLMSLLPPPPVDRGASQAQLEERHLALLQEDRAPDPAWVVLMGLGFALWMGAVAWATRRGWDDDDRPQWPVLRVAGAVVAVGMLLFFVSLARA
jgi:hypothetical protein